jgi:hypothetical protein
MALKWVCNNPRRRLGNYWNKIIRGIDEDFLSDKIIGEPQMVPNVPNAFTVEQLKAMDMVGLYVESDNHDEWIKLNGLG